MTSYTLLKSENYSDDERKVVINICDDLEKVPMNSNPNCDGVYICRVPVSLSWLKPEAFKPKLVGLGPYHHFHDDLIMTQQLKLGIGKRFLKHTENEAMFQQRLQNIVFDSQLFYHIDVHNKYDHHILLHMLIVDGLFLLALLHSGIVTTIIEETHTFFLTGKSGMPLVNQAGLDLNIRDVIKDVFMIENQIPTHVLKQINITRSTDQEDIQSPYEDLGSAMQLFCEAHCPLVDSKNLAKIPEDHHHLLDLMYHLVAAPDSDHELKPEPQLQAQPHQHDYSYTRRRNIVYPILFFCVLYVFVARLYGFIATITTKLSGSVLNKVIPGVVAAPQTELRSNFTFNPRLELYNLVKRIRGFLSWFRVKWLQPYIQILEEINQKFMKSTSSASSDEAVIRSATKFRPYFRFEAAEGGRVASIKFDEINRQLTLPRIRLDLTSEVIIRNLLAYESLTKSDGLIFTFFIKLMSNLIVTVEDVELLVDEKIIIKSQLSDEAIVQLFKELGKSVNAGPTRMQKLEQEITEVNDQMYALESVQLFVFGVIFPLYATFIYSFICFLLVPKSVSLVKELFCSFATCSKFCAPPEVGDYPWWR